ncbi:MAG: hypothetical protein M1839_000628 [Geoglossum umbratile]|nr:MAG: hypothetical protein M1839_000628 [Geoglossum umbratile]
MLQVSSPSLRYRIWSLDITLLQLSGLLPEPPATADNFVVTSYLGFSGTVIGETTATDTAHVWVDLNPGIILSLNDVLAVSQEIERGGFTYRGEVWTDPLENYDAFMGASDRNIYVDPEEPLSACQTTIHLLGGIPGVKYGLDNEAPREAKLIITAPEFPDQCGKAPTKPKEFPVSPETPPSVPENIPAPCLDSESLSFEGLVPEGTLTIVHGDGRGDIEAIGWGNGNGKVPLPLWWNLAEGRTTFFQTDVCGKSSSTGTVVPRSDTPSERLGFLGDLYECSSFIAFSGSPGARTTVLRESGSRLSTPSIPKSVFVDGSEALVVHTPILWGKLYRRDVILLRQEDCGSKRDSDEHKRVEPLPEKLFTLQFDPPTGHIYTDSSTVTVKDALPGALIRVFADGTPVGQAEAYSDPVTVPIGGPHFPHFPEILESGQVITAIQSFYCNPGSVISSLPQQPGITVTEPHIDGTGNEAVIIGQKVLKEL